jgi:hypothetical protein
LEVEPLEDRTLLATIQWINPAGGSWHTESNWNLERLLTSDDDVVINVPGDVTITHSSGSTSIRSLMSQETLTLSAGTLSISSASEVNNLTLSGATLTGAGSLTVAGTMDWDSGTLGGPGSLVVGAGGQLNIRGTALEAHTFAGRSVDSTAGAVNWTGGEIHGPFDHTGLLNISGSATKYFSGTINQLGGTTVWTGTGLIGLTTEAAVFHNHAAAVFEARTDSQFWPFSGISAVRNDGTFR